MSQGISGDDRERLERARVALLDVQDLTRAGNLSRGIGPDAGARAFRDRVRIQLRKAAGFLEDAPTAGTGYAHRMAQLRELSDGSPEFENTRTRARVEWLERIHGKAGEVLAELERDGVKGEGLEVRPAAILGTQPRPVPRVIAAMERDARRPRRVPLGALPAWTDPIKPGSYYAISGAALLGIADVMRRLYVEERMDGDEMRNAAQALEARASEAAELPMDPGPAGLPLNRAPEVLEPRPVEQEG